MPPRKKKSRTGGVSPSTAGARGAAATHIHAHANDTALGSAGDPGFTMTLGSRAAPTRTSGTQSEQRSRCGRRPKSRRRSKNPRPDLAAAAMSGGTRTRVRFEADEADPRHLDWLHKQLDEYHRQRRAIRAAVRDLNALRAVIMQEFSQVELDLEEDEEDEIPHFDGDHARVLRRQHEDDDDDFDDFPQGRPLRAGM